MNAWKWIAAGIGSSSVLPAAWMLWHPTYAAGIFLTIWSAVASPLAAWYVWHRESRMRKINQRSLEQRAIQTLNHHRHDWMNELQILYGYIQLGKLDKSVQCVERIKEHMLQDSKISKLGIPSLVFYLQSYRTLNTGLQLDVDVVDQVQLEGKLLPNTEEDFTQSIMRIIQVFQQSGTSTWEEERLLTLTFMEQDQELVAEFDGEGSFGDLDTLRQQIELSVQDKEMRVEQIHTSSTTYRLCIPYVI
ncbi:Spo0B domain-containing protein [Paenibacillus dakarensis]|uniref:Spo0B domain-containing protein n=1 Tax=Paenibacillus dakarensis TaxID=1527293 RepID=UPI0009EB1433|nr:Spo0B domain-containing protein [Paenibacillus dakarensis]